METRSGDLGIPLTVRPSTRKRLKAPEVQKSMDRIAFQIDQLRGLAEGHVLEEWREHFKDRVILLTRAQGDLRIKFAKMVDEVLENDEKFGKDFIDNKAITARFGIKRENRKAKREAEADAIQELKNTTDGDRVIGSVKERLRRNKKKPKPEAAGAQPSLRL